MPEFAPKKHEKHGYFLQERTFCCVSVATNLPDPFLVKEVYTVSLTLPILDATKSRFGVLFSKKGISGATKTENAEWERIKVFYDRGIVIVVLTLEDLKKIASGVNLIGMLRQRYETVRLDLPDKNRPT
jgi:hypothetical protein